MKTLVDGRGCAVSGATPAALTHGEDALAAVLGWRGHADESLARALEEAPQFVMPRLLPAWSRELPDHHAVLAMLAFGLVENGEVGRAEQTARAALASSPLDVRAHHVMAHVFENSRRAEAGASWMERHRDGWAGHSAHCWWHLALF